MEFLDQFSSPCRELLNGLRIDLLNGTIEFSKKPLILKITALALLTFFAPKFGCLVAAFSLASLGIKAVFLKISTEFNKIDAQFEKIRIDDKFYNKSDEKKIDLFKKHEFLRDDVANQQRFAEAVVKRYDLKQISLDDVTESLKLISDKQTIIKTISRILSSYLSDLNGAPYTLLEFNNLIKDSLKDDEESIKVCAFKILRKHKITSKIDMNSTYEHRLKDVLLIEDVITLLEEHGIKDRRDNAFTNVINYNKYERVNIREFLTVMATLKKETANLIKFVKETDKITYFETTFEKLINIAKTMNFPSHENLPDLQIGMTSLLMDRRHGWETTNKELKVQKINEVYQEMRLTASTLLFSNRNHNGGFNLKVYYQRECITLSTCLKEAIDHLIS